MKTSAILGLSVGFALAGSAQMESAEVVVESDAYLFRVGGLDAGPATRVYTGVESHVPMLSGVGPGLRVAVSLSPRWTVALRVRHLERHADYGVSDVLRGDNGLRLNTVDLRARRLLGAGFHLEGGYRFAAVDQSRNETRWSGIPTPHPLAMAYRSRIRGHGLHGGIHFDARIAGPVSAEAGLGIGHVWKDEDVHDVRDVAVYTDGRSEIVSREDPYAAPGNVPILDLAGGLRIRMSRALSLGLRFEHANWGPKYETDNYLRYGGPSVVVRYRFGRE